MRNALNDGDKRMDMIKNQYTEIEIRRGASLWDKGAPKAINDQIDVVKANKKYNPAKRRQYNASPRVVAG